MAPAEMRPSVAAFFGEDGDPRPLWFRKDVFMEADFDPDTYIANLRSFVPLETLRGELRSHTSALKNELVELINKDYNDYVNLSTNLVDVDGAVLRMRTPLEELSYKLVAVRDSVEASLFSVKDALKRRAEASASREILELLLDTSHVVSKIEKLLQELTGMQQDGSSVVSRDLSEAALSLEESRSRLLERIASEMNRLKFYVARCQDLPFIQTIEKRIKNADLTLSDNLMRCFVLGLERRDAKVLYHCLRAYVAIDDVSGAESAFRTTVVAPFIQKIISPATFKGVVAGAGDKLAHDFEEVEKKVESECKFLLDIVASEKSGFHVFNFLGNSVVKEVYSTIQKARPGALSPGKPDEFLENYRSSLKFLAFIEGLCQSEATVLQLRSQPSYTDFVRLWNLGAYFTVRFQEIAGALDGALAAELRRTQEDGGFAFQSSVKLLECLERCWQNDVYTSAISDKLLRLSLQLIHRYVTWLSSGLAARKLSNSSETTWASAASLEDFLLLRNDAELLHGKLTGAYTSHVMELLAPVAEKVVGVVQQSILRAAQALLDNGAELTDVVATIISDKCCEVAKSVKTLATTYRMTNKPVPTRPSVYASNILQSLKEFLEGRQKLRMTEACRQEILRSVLTKVTIYYEQRVREFIDSARKTESSLAKIRRIKTGAGSDPNEVTISDFDKVVTQVFLDVEEYGRQMDALGLAAASIPAFESLWKLADEAAHRGRNQ